MAPHNNDVAINSYHCSYYYIYNV